MMITSPTTVSGAAAVAEVDAMDERQREVVHPHAVRHDDRTAATCPASLTSRGRSTMSSVAPTRVMTRRRSTAVSRFLSATRPDRGDQDADADRDPAEPRRQPLEAAVARLVQQPSASRPTGQRRRRAAPPEQA